MTTFQATGTIRDLPEEIEGKIGFVIISDDGKTVLPVFVEESKLQKRVVRELIVGAKVEISGQLKSTVHLLDGHHMIRMWLVADKITIIRRAIVQFKRNIILNKLLDMYDLDNLYRVYKHKGEKNEQ